MDDNKKQEARELRDITKAIRKIDIQDKANDRNETHMKDVYGREVEFKEQW